MNIIDVNAWLGAYPWRQLRHNTVTALLHKMDEVGIEQAIVSSIEAVYNNNPQPANEQLYHDTLACLQRLLPFATMNPTYADWEHDLTVCHADWHMLGLRVFPVHHGYALGDKAFEALLAAARERNLPVTLCVRLVDHRQHHWLDSTADLDQALLAGVIASHPDNQFMVLNSMAPASTWQVIRGRQVLFDISRLTALNISLSPISYTIPSFINLIGPEQLAFGSGMPFSVPEVGLVKLSILSQDILTASAIAGGNATRMLRLPNPLPAPERFSNESG